MTPNEIVDLLGRTFGQAVLESKTEGVLNPWALVAPERLRDIAFFCRDDERLQFDSLMCLSGMDHGAGSLGVVYHLDSTGLGHKVVLKVKVPVADPRIPSVEAVWKCANWQEREAYDMVGVVFDGHPDLRRILLPDDWDGFPLRKDYQVPEYYNGMKVPS
jgi:NADH-quinone oxidoreductase subunit C